tara:strand:- start:393 stop:974 length:582 start_codon:yes stop_codon:yes gene_type:complete
MGTLFVDKLDPQSGTSLEIGSSGDTMTVPSGATLTIAGTINASSGTATGFGSSVLCDPFFHATRSGSHNIADQTNSVIPFNAEVADTDNAFDTSTYRFTVPSGKAGRYFFYTYIGSDDGNSFNYYNTKIRKNGSIISEWMNYHAPNSAGFAQAVATLAVSDYIDVVVYQNRGDVSALNPAAASTFFIGYRLTT